MRKLITSIFAIVTSCAASVALPQDVAVLYSNLGTTTQWARAASEEVVWDDLQLAGGGLLTGLTVVVNNSRVTPQPGSLSVIEFRRFDNPNGGPVGTLLGSVTIDLRGQMLPRGDSTIAVDNLAGYGVVLPPDRVAIGVTFNDPTKSLGLITFDPPTVGASSPAAWVGTDPTPFICELTVGQLLPCNFGFELRSVSMPIQIDVKPCISGNGINLKKEYVRVAIFGSSTFDALQVDPVSARFGPQAAQPRRHEIRDYNSDGYMDLGLIFRIRHVGFACGDQQVTLAATTYAGEAVTGTDAVRAWNCRR